MVSSLLLAISFLPAPVQAIIIGAVALLVIIAVFRIIGLVLNAIPFL